MTQRLRKQGSFWKGSFSCQSCPRVMSRSVEKWGQAYGLLQSTIPLAVTVLSWGHSRVLLHLPEFFVEACEIVHSEWQYGTRSQNPYHIWFLSPYNSTLVPELDPLGVFHIRQSQLRGHIHARYCTSSGQLRHVTILWHAKPITSNMHRPQDFGAPAAAPQLRLETGLAACLKHLGFVAACIAWNSSTLLKNAETPIP